MFSLAGKLAGGRDPLIVTHRRNVSMNNPSNTNDYSIALGDEHKNRKVYVFCHGRTNSTTGTRRFTGVSIIVGGTTYTGVRIAANHTTNNVDNPQAVFEIDIPDGTVGTLRIQVSGAGTTLAYMWAHAYAAIGKFTRIDQKFQGGGAISVDAANQGAYMAGHFGDSGFSPNGTWTSLDINSNVTGVNKVVGGRRFPTTAPTEGTSTGGGYSLAVSLAP